MDAAVTFHWGGTMNNRFLLSAILLSLSLLSVPASAGQTSQESNIGTGGSDLYRQSMVSRIRPNWTPPGQAKNYTAVVNVKINPDGSVRKATIVRSSGSSFIDSSVIQAIMDSTLEPPPPGISEMNLTFNTDQLFH